MSDLQTCPNCGTPVGPQFAFSQMVACESCGTTLVRDSDMLRMAGEAGVMLEAPSLIKLGQSVRIAGEDYTPVGHMRFDYGGGWWDEFWCPRSVASPDGVWISVDEGDYAIETRVPARAAPTKPAKLVLGHEVQFDDETYMLSETDRATCIAFRGGVPEEIVLGETHDYANYTSPTGGLLSLEVWDGGHAWHRGAWVDPWKIEVLS